jgi:proteasome lid subunit RPN8/RPN11
MLHLSPEIYEQLRAHAEETYPHECCGVLLGKLVGDDWLVERSLRAGNTRTDSAHNRYQISPLELIKIEREARKLGLYIAGFYHSHPGHPAQWSKTDFEEAHWLGCSYVITAVEQGRATITNSFRLQGTNEEEKHFDQESIQVGDVIVSGKPDDDRR